MEASSWGFWFGSRGVSDLWDVLQGYYFSTTNPFRDQPNAFIEGQEKARQGDLNAAVLLLEAAILQDPNDAEVSRGSGSVSAC